MKYLLAIFILVNSFISYSQNLIPNYSFEDTVSCPMTFSNLAIDSKRWYSPSLISSPELFHSCATTSPLGVPINHFGNQLPHSSNAYTGIGTYVNNGGREYISVRLNQTLSINNIYCFSMYVSLADSSRYASNKLGVYFSKDSLYSSTLLNLTNIPQIEFTQMITDTTRRVSLEAQYQAVGGEEFITIGNFKDNLNTDTLYVRNTSIYPYSYYYLDDISLTLCKTSDSLHLNLPNVFTPNGDGENDNFVIEVLGAKNLKKLSAKVYNRWGMLVTSSQFDSNQLLAISNQTLKINNQQLAIWDGYTTAAAQAPQGTYYYTVTYTTINDETFTEKSYLTLFR